MGHHGGISVLRRRDSRNLAFLALSVLSEDTMRRWPSARQEEGSHQGLSLIAP